MSVVDNSVADLVARAEAAFRFAVADPTSAGPVASAVVDEARRAGQPEPLVIGLRARAWSAFRLLAGGQAKGLLDEAARLARAASLDVRLGEVLVSRAAVNLELGRSRSAQRDLDRARPLLGGAAPPELEFLSGVFAQNAGRLSTAAAIYRRVLGDARAAVDIRAKATNNLGLIEAQFGHYGSAMTLVARAQELAREVGPAMTAYFTESRALVTASAGRLPASLDLFEQAERLYEVAGLPRAELLVDHAEAMSDLRLLPEAADAAQRAAAEFDASGAVLMRAEAELRVARLALLAGNLELASSSASTAELTLRLQGRAGWAASAVAVTSEARAKAGTATATDLRRVRRAAATLERLQLTANAVEAHLTAARLAVTLERTQWALSSFDRAFELARDGPVLTRLRGRLAAASAAGLRGDDRQLLLHCRTALADLDRHRAVFASTELRVLASAHGSELGHIGLRTLVRSGTALEVFKWMERTRAAALVVVQRITVPGAEGELALLRGLQAEIEASGGGSPALIARHAVLENQLRRVTWARTAAHPSTTKATPVAEIRQLLGHRMLIEYGILDDHVFAAVVSPRRVVLVPLGPLEAVQREVDGLFFVLRLLSRRRATATTGPVREVAEQRLDRLRDLLIRPLVRSGALPATDGELVIVPAGLLQRVPWSALNDGPVSVAPSAAFWARARQRPTPATDKVVLVAGPGLPSVEEEVRVLGALHENGVVLHSPDSTVNRVVESLQTAGLAHFACHGRVRSDNPMFSGLLLSDGSLTVQELELRDIAPHRIVLAACEAAADVSYPGEEMLGFVSALLARGTAGMVASMILVPDTAAVQMMLSLHERLRRGDTMAVALHAARSAVNREDPHELVNWCGFTAYGAA